MKAIAGAAALLLLCAGCASVTQGTTHSLRIETETSSGQNVVDADCALSNDQGTTHARSGETTIVRRSSKDLEITCSKAGLPDAGARLVSRANAGLAGNIILGGAIGAMIDHNSGAAYTYPGWVRLVFGEYAVLDRKNDRDGLPLAASPGTTTPLAATPVKAQPTASANATPVNPVAAATPAQPASSNAPARDGRLVRGQSFDYQVTDRDAAKSHLVILRVDRVDDSQVLFNGGARIEKPNGELVHMGTPLLGELDAVTPPGGWMTGGRLPGGSWPIRFTSSANGQRTAYDLTAHAGREQTIRVKAGEFRAIRVDLEGWINPVGKFNAAATRYKAVLWFSSELRRVIRFEVECRAGSNTSSSYFSISEVAELTGIHND